MRVILTEKVRSLGNVGEIVNVSAGHARNYLIPNKFAVLADESNQKVLDDQQRRLAKKIQEEKDAATAIKSKLDGKVIALVKRVGGNGKLFGTVTNAELSKELEKDGIDVEKRLIIIENPIKSLGEYDVVAKLFSGVESNFKVKVEIDPKQAEEMKKKQADAAKKKAAAAAEAKAEATEEAKAEEAAEETTEA